jgi:hypothetical protein
VRDSAVESEVLRLLERWGRLPLSDVERLLPPLLRPRLQPRTLADLEQAGLISLEQVGDEQVLVLVRGGESRATERPSVGASGSEAP